MICKICDQEPLFRWTDTHGVAQCICGAPYRLYHYDDNNKRQSKAPELLVSPEWIDRCRQFWEKYKTPIPGCHSFDPAYERSTEEGRILFHEFCKQFA